MQIISNSYKHTLAIGECFSHSLRKNDVIILNGQLGTGKTVFIKGALRGLGMEEEKVISPSFTIIKEYKIKDLSIFHIDLYRIKKVKELTNLGYEDYFYKPDGITFIEWGERIEDILSIYIKVNISFIDETKRKLFFSLKGYNKSKLSFLSYMLKEPQ